MRKILFSILAFVLIATQALAWTPRSAIDQNYLLSVGIGNFGTDAQRLYRTGINADVGTSWEMLANHSSAFTELTSAEALKVVSGSANDDVGGTGATQITIVGLDGDYAAQTEVVSMNGTTAVTTSNSFLRVNEAYVSAGATNAGVITVKDNGATNTLLQIDAGDGDAHAAKYTVPAGYTYYMIQWHGSEVSNQGTEFAIWSHINGDIDRLRCMIHAIDSFFHLPLQVPFAFDEKTDITIQVKAGAASEVSGGFEGILVKD